MAREFVEALNGTYRDAAGYWYRGQASQPGDEQIRSYYSDESIAKLNGMRAVALATAANKKKKEDRKQSLHQLLKNCCPWIQ
jgi:hypothetical protein